MATKTGPLAANVSINGERQTLSARQAFREQAVFASSPCRHFRAVPSSCQLHVRACAYVRALCCVCSKPTANAVSSALHTCGVISPSLFHITHQKEANKSFRDPYSPPTVMDELDTKTLTLYGLALALSVYCLWNGQKVRRYHGAFHC